MKRRSFLKILPGFLAAKTIAKELAKPKTVERLGIYHQLKSKGNVVTYKHLTKNDLEKAISDLYTRTKTPSLRIFVGSGWSKEYPRDFL